MTEPKPVPTDRRSAPTPGGAATEAPAPIPPATRQPAGERGGPRGPEPTRFGDWEKNGRCFDF